MNLGQLKGALEALGVWSKKRLEGFFVAIDRANGYVYGTNSSTYRVSPSISVGTLVLRTTGGRADFGDAISSSNATTLGQVQTLINDRLSSVDALDPTTATLEDLINAIQNGALVPLAAAKTLELTDDDYLESGETI